ncbi:glycosyltransferase [Candidatus Pelagibacter sp.]|nr:glycosyltransferase [Candidatus Pelagibacter sp.]
MYGDEPREKIDFKHKNLKVLGFKKHKEILEKFKQSSISVVCSRWEEPFGRTALEASSRGCAVIISNRGGLNEAASFGLKINKLNTTNLFNKINSLILDSQYRLNVQKKTLVSFKYSNDYVSKKIDKYRNKLI